MKFILPSDTAINCEIIRNFTGHGSLIDNGEVVYVGMFKKGKPVINEKYYPVPNHEVKSEYDDTIEMLQKCDSFVDDFGYVGETKNGNYHGKGTLCKNGKIVYKGEWKNGEYNGIGILYDHDNSITYRGYFLNGKPHGKIEYKKVLSRKSMCIINGICFEGMFQGNAIMVTTDYYDYESLSSCIRKSSVYCNNHRIVKVISESETEYNREGRVINVIKDCRVNFDCDIEI